MIIDKVELVILPPREDKEVTQEDVADIYIELITLLADE